jgi:hypothetical protein
VSLAAFLEGVVAVLDEAEVIHVPTGSRASAFYAVPKATQDIDVVIEAAREGIERLVRGLLAAGWYADRDAALDAWQGQSQFHAVLPDTGWKADFIIGKDRAYSREEFGRRERISVLGVELAVASLELEVDCAGDRSTCVGSASRLRTLRRSRNPRGRQKPTQSLTEDGMAGHGPILPEESR